MSRINTNVQSILATRVLSGNQNTLNRALTRLSTGLRINSGKDDPAGLIASETLRASKVAITAAIDNANRADSIMAVAEGGLQEINSLLLEIESLLDKSANEGGLSDEEVAANQLQLDAILQSINRISEQSSFGTKKLLNGAFDYTTSGVSTTNIDNLRVNSARVPEGSYSNVVINVVTPSEFAYVSAVGGGTGGTLGDDVTIQVRGNYGTEIFSFVSGSSTATVRDAINAVTQLTGVSAVVSGQAVVFSSTGYGDNAFVSVERIDTNGQSEFDIHGATTTKRFGVDGTMTVNGTAAIVNGLELQVRSGTISLDVTLDASFASVAGGTTSFQITGGGAKFAISPDLGLSGQESIGLYEVSTANLGNGSATIGYISSLATGQANSLTSGNFAQSQRIVRSAIEQISSLRGRIGAFQRNTLQTTVNSLGVAFENIAAAESAIRDADFAQETSNLTRSQILVNAATAALQLANSAPQNVLALLG
ncbi:MAG: flagellin [Phycisphaerae bacterium]|nr:MAG: flagellin [Planctomycetota bacterium]KAB2948634.1 MAG: flagellin [Phycisphaerae bacterium]MBE7457782.1 flagellin [Planctomycetia bacterium]MCK6463699.1 flagellin [Phycisphaerae bacterium]MCL4717586.1 flagellin [Phycisphaerae bacterium]